MTTRPCSTAAQRGGDSVDDSSTVQECPECRSLEVPHLIVRFGSSEPDGLSWRCRVCQHEWSTEPSIWE